MPDLAELTPSAVEIPAEQLVEGVVLDDASAVGQEVRCIIPSFDPLKATDPMLWAPWMGADGLYFPKKGDRAVLAFQAEGAPVITLWQPSATVADEAIGGAADDALLANGIGVVVGTGPRLTNFAHTWWFSTTEPEGVEEYDLWTKPE